MLPRTYVVIIILRLVETLEVKFLQNPIGIYYEPIHKVRLTNSRWKLFITLEIDDLERATPFASQDYGQINLVCIRKMARMDCPFTSRVHSLKEMDFEIEKKIMEIKKVARLLGSTDKEDMPYQANITDVYYNRGEEAIKLGEGIYTIRSSISEKIKNIAGDYRLPERQAMEVVIKEEAKEEDDQNLGTYAVALNAWLEKSFIWRIKYKELLQEVMNIIIKMIQGKLPMELENFRAVVQEVVTPKGSAKIEDRLIYGILESARVSGIYQKEKLGERIIFIADFPKLTDQVYYFIELHEYPVPRREEGGTVTIKPRARKMIMSEDRK